MDSGCSGECRMQWWIQDAVVNAGCSGGFRMQWWMQGEWMQDTGLDLYVVCGLKGEGTKLTIHTWLLSRSCVCSSCTVPPSSETCSTAQKDMG